MNITLGVEMDFSRIKHITWYPGHMLKAERQLKEKLKLIDVIIEILDARAPQSSLNPNFLSLLGQKGHLLLLNKTDLVEKSDNERWLEYFQGAGKSCFSLNFKDRKKIARIPEMIRKESARGRQARGVTTPQLRATRAMIIGLPNVGKSTLINTVLKKKHTKTGPTPGLTRQQQWVKLPDNVELLDTPGVMTPSIPDAETGLKLGLIASIKDKIVGRDLLAEYLLYRYKTHAPEIILERYKFGEYPENIDSFLDAVARQQGYLTAGDAVDRNKAAAKIIGDFRGGKLGRFCLELPA